MSGIAGILNLDGSPVNPTDLERMAQALAHRGPDGSGFWCDGSMGLVYLRLEIDPEPPQPFIHDGVVVVLDGRIDNLSLLTRLIARANRRRSPHPTAFMSGNGMMSAPEALVAAYRQWGLRLPRLLLGDFAFALWDASNERLILARDPIGIKPLFYFQDERRLIFASEAKAILAVPGVPCEPNRRKFREFKRFRFRTAESTFFERIFRLFPGKALVVEKGRISQYPFWTPDVHRKIRLPNREAYRKRFRRLFLEAVRCRLPKSGMVAFTLSGGLDSSAVVGATSCIKKAERPGLSLITVSLLSHEFPDERDHIRTVCQTHGLENIPLIAEDINPLEDVESAVFIQESPYYDFGDADIAALFRAARQKGAHVLLSGEWGDNVLTSLAYLSDLLREGCLIRSLKEFRALVREKQATPREILKPVVWHAVFPNGITSRFHGLRYFLSKFIPGIPSDDPDLPPTFPLAAKREIFDGFFCNLLRREGEDKMASAVGLEVRLPFLDRRLVEFLLAIPTEEIVRDGLGKRLLRESLDGILPQSIASRKDKGDFTELYNTRLRKAGFVGSKQGEEERPWYDWMEKIWEEIWIKSEKPRTENKKSLTRSPTSLSTVT